MMRVVIIIVTYNGMRWLPKCLGQLFNNEQSIDVLIVDNNSNDNSVSFVKENYPQIKLLELKENIGFGKANNVGLKIAREQLYDYTFLLNQDGYINYSTILDLIEVAQHNPDYGILSPVHMDNTEIHLDESFLYYLRSDKKAKNYLEDLVFKKPLKEIYEFSMINAAAWLLPLKTLNIVGGFNPIFFLYGEDDNYCQRVIYHNLKIGIVPKNIFVHDSLNTNKTSFEEGSVKYYNMFLNRFKVKYCNVLTSDYENQNSYKKQLLKIVLKSFLKLSIKGMKLNFKKIRLISSIDCEEIVEKDRIEKPSYLID